jgi:glycosyltransferase involved in cell wall biosynthesis
LITVIIPTHNPNLRRLERTLSGLVGQTLPRDRWKVLIVDNASRTPVTITSSEINSQVLREARLGLTRARLCGLEHTESEIVIFVDDDNVLSPDYLRHIEVLTQRFPRLGALGGKSLPDWEDPQAVPDWIHEFSHNLALRDLGEEEIVGTLTTECSCYPTFSPIGAGMAVRKAAIAPWTESVKNGKVITDRTGKSLSSGGDNDIVLHCIKAGYGVGYFPELKLHHIIPANRLTLSYHARLSYASMRSWVGVLNHHDLSPWKGIPRGTSSVRKLKSFFRCCAWNSPEAWIRWHSACGLVDGQADIARASREHS